MASPFGPDYFDPYLGSDFDPGNPNNMANKIGLQGAVNPMRPRAQGNNWFDKFKSTANPLQQTNVGAGAGAMDVLGRALGGGESMDLRGKFKEGGGGFDGKGLANVGNAAVNLATAGLGQKIDFGDPSVTPDVARAEGRKKAEAISGAVGTAASFIPVVGPVLGPLISMMGSIFGGKRAEKTAMGVQEMREGKKNQILDHQKKQMMEDNDLKNLYQSYTNGPQAAYNM